MSTTVDNGTAEELPDLPKEVDASTLLALGIVASLAVGLLVGMTCALVPGNGTVNFFAGLIVGTAVTFLWGLKENPEATLSVPKFLKKRTPGVVVKEGLAWECRPLFALDPVDAREKNCPRLIKVLAVNPKKTEEKIEMTIQADLRCKVVDPYLAQNVDHVFGRDGGQDGTIFDGPVVVGFEAALRAFATSKSADDLPLAKDLLPTEVTARATANFRKMGLMITRVNVQDIGFPEEIQRALNQAKAEDAERDRDRKDAETMMMQARIIAGIPEGSAQRVPEWAVRAAQIQQGKTTGIDIRGGKGSFAEGAAIDAATKNPKRRS